MVLIAVGVILRVILLPYIGSFVDRVETNSVGASVKALREGVFLASIGRVRGREERG